MSTHIKGWSHGDVIGTLRHLGCVLVVDGLYLRIGRALFCRARDGTWSVAAGGLHRHTHTLEEMLAAQQAITPAGALLCDQWSGWIVGGATAGGEVGDVGVVEPSTAVSPFKVGDVVEYTGRSWYTLANPCTVILADCEDKYSRVTDAKGARWFLAWSEMRKVEPAQGSVTTENGTFKVGDPITVWSGGKRRLGIVHSVDQDDPVRPVRVTLDGYGPYWPRAVDICA